MLKSVFFTQAFLRDMWTFKFLLGRLAKMISPILVNHSRIMFCHSAVNIETPPFGSLL